MKIILFAIAANLLCLGQFTFANAEEKKPLPERVKEFTEVYKTPEAIDAKLKEWSEKEPQNPDPYIFAANAYLKIASQVNISSGNTNGGFAIRDQKTNEQVGTISEEKDIGLIKKAGSILATASTKFPLRLDIFVGRLSLAESAEDTAALLAAGLDMIKAAQAHPDKMTWIDGKPLPYKLPEKITDEIQGRIKRLYEKENDEADTAAYKLATEALRIAPNDVRLLNDAALFHSYKKEWQKACEFFVRAAKAEPQDTLVKMNLALAHLNCGEPEAAKKQWEEVIKIAPKSHEADDAREQLSKLSKKPGIK